MEGGSQVIRNMTFKGTLWSQPLQLSLLPGHHVMNRPPLPHTPSMVHYATTGPKQWSQVTMDWNLGNHKPKEIFPPLSWFSQVFCFSDKKTLSKIMECLKWKSSCWVNKSSAKKQDKKLILALSTNPRASWILTSKQIQTLSNFPFPTVYNLAQATVTIHWVCITLTGIASNLVPGHPFSIMQS
jgi:hypothetical protein